MPRTPSFAAPSLAAVSFAAAAAVAQPKGAPPPPPKPNGPPVASAGKLSATEDQPATGTLAATDPDGDALRFTVLRAPKGGKVELTAVEGHADAWSIVASNGVLPLAEIL